MTTSTTFIDPVAVHELAPGGVLRAAINLGNSVLVQRDPASGALGGVSIDLARELARRLGVAVEFVVFDAAGKVFEALQTDAWDVAFLAVDPSRSAELAFTAPYVLIEGNFLVRSDSPLRHPNQVDQAGMRVAVGAGSAYDLFLTRSFKSAQLVRCPTAAAAFALFLQDGLDAAAGVKQVLRKFADTHGELRILDDSFMTIRQAMGTPKDRVDGARLLSTFIEEAKRSGFVAAALQRSGQSDAALAPAAPEN
jgi:polar amino acid transport system substrate-binding protein